MNDALPPRWAGTNKCLEGLLRAAHETFHEYSRSSKKSGHSGHQHQRRRRLGDAEEAGFGNGDFDDAGGSGNGEFDDDGGDDEYDEPDELTADPRNGSEEAAAGGGGGRFAEELAVVMVDIPRLLGSSAGQLKASVDAFNRTEKAECAWRLEESFHETKGPARLSDDHDDDDSTALAERYRLRSNGELYHVRYDYARQLKDVVLGASFSHAQVSDEDLEEGQTRILLSLRAIMCFME